MGLYSPKGKKNGTCLANKASPKYGSQNSDGAILNMRVRLNTTIKHTSLTTTTMSPRSSDHHHQTHNQQHRPNQTIITTQLVKQSIKTTHN